MDISLTPISLILIGAAVAGILSLLRAGRGRARRRGEGATRADRAENYRVARVRRVIDGDTVIVATGWRELTLRLDAIDCPEWDQYWGDTAKYGLIKLIGGRQIRFEEHGRDNYGRTAATIYVWHEGRGEWLNVNARMVTLGHAWVSSRRYSNFPKHQHDDLIRLERWARSRRVGLWRAGNPVPPWKWRNHAD